MHGCHATWKVKKRALIEEQSVVCLRMGQSSLGCRGTSSPAKVANAVSLYDLEGYDDAFFKEVEEVEERHNSSPLKSPQQGSLQAITQGLNKYSMFGAAICRNDLTPKRLDFAAAVSRSSHVVEKVRIFYERLVGSFESIPSLEQLEAHGELSQEKALLVLSYFANGGWEKAVSADDLRRFKDMEMPEIDGWMRVISKSSKSSKIDWSKQWNSHIVFHCEISCEGSYSIKGPYFEQTNSPLQRVFGNGGVLRVHFADLKKNSEVAEGRYRKISRDGLWIGLRHYTFFAFKDPKGKKKQGLMDTSSVPKCFFVCTESLAKSDFMNPSFRQFSSIFEAQQYLMHIHTVSSQAKKNSRLQLALSQTVSILDLNSPGIDLQILEDIYCTDEFGNIVCDRNGERLIHTDGTGFISKDIAARCPASVCKGSIKADCYDKDPPLLLQVRLFYKGMVAKGTLLVNSKLPPLTIQLRKSMVKVYTDPSLYIPSYNSLEVCSTSRKPGKAKLSPYLALLLTYGGVPDSVLMQFVEDELEEVTARLKSQTVALSVLRDSDQGRGYFDAAIRMLAANFPMTEPYLQKVLSDSARLQLQDLRSGRVTIPGTCNLMGCADPTGLLERHQVAIILEGGPLYCPKVLVYKSPGLHVGDVKVFEATWNAEFESIVGPGKYVIFFSVKGPRSVVDEIANSDLDGDQYWCCSNPEVVRHFKSSEVWQNPGADKKMGVGNRCSVDDFAKQHFEAYLKARFKPSSTMGVAANSWHAHMDRYLMLPEESPGRQELWCRIQSLVNTYYEAVDAEKTGKQVFVREEDKAKEWPHYKEKNDHSSWIRRDVTYMSTTILGKIYDLVMGVCDTKEYILKLERMVLENKFLEPRLKYDGYEAFVDEWDQRFKAYKAKMSQCMSENDNESRNNEIEELFAENRWVLYKSDTLIDSLEPEEKIFKQASAIYSVVYNYAKNRLNSLQEKEISPQGLKLGLQFAWKVAGYALVKIFKPSQGNKRREPIYFDHEVFQGVKFARKH